VVVFLLNLRFDMNAKLYREAKGFFSESLAGERSGADAEPTLKDRTYTHISRIDADLLRYYGVANQGRSLARIRFDAQELARAIARKGFR
jgi:hypothetical protein